MLSIRCASLTWACRLLAALFLALMVAGCNLPRFGAPTPAPPPTATPLPPAAPASTVAPTEVAPTEGAAAGALSPTVQEASPPAGTLPPAAQGRGGYAGEVVAARRVAVAAAVAGRVVELAVAEGGEVRAGDVLLRIDAAALEAHRAQALAALEAAQAQLDLLSAEVMADELEAAQAAAAAATAAYQRLVDEAGAEADVGPGGSSPDAAEMAAEVAAAYAELARTRAELARLEQGPDPAQLQAARARVELAATDLYLAQLQLDQAVLRAPINGVIAEVQTAVGAELAPGDPVATVLSPEREVRFAVEESALPALRIGRRVQVRLTAYPDEPLPGEVVRIAPELDAATRTVEVTAAPLGGGVRLLPGMSATVELEVEREAESGAAPGEVADPEK